MENKTKELQRKLDVCKRQLLGLKIVINIPCLNKFCAEIVGFTNKLRNFLEFCVKKLCIKIERNITVETIFLSLSQIITCIRHLERIINADEGNNNNASKQHFLDRIQWCLERLDILLRILAEDPLATTDTPLEHQTFVDLINTVFEKLSTYNGYRNKSDVINDKAENDAGLAKEVRSIVDLIARHALAFANVSLKQEKKMITAHCQIMLSECIGFEKECALEDKKLKAQSLEKGIFNLEVSINKAMLTLIYTCFLDIEEMSITKLREVIHKSNPNDSTVFDFIADFDANIDRLTQIGIFAIAYAPDIKSKTILRSCLASLESLDVHIVPALQSLKLFSKHHSEVLEQHYNEEIAIFKEAVQGIIISKDFMTSFIEILGQCIRTMEKRFHKHSLLEMVQMAVILYQHFSHIDNHKDFIDDSNSPKYIHFEKFGAILCECLAILKHAEQVDPKRIIKRFKIMWSILIKFRDLFINNNSHLTNVKDQKEKIDQTNGHNNLPNTSTLETIEISPSTHNKWNKAKVEPKVNPSDTPMKRTKNNLDTIVNETKRLTTEILAKVTSKIPKKRNFLRK